MNRSTWDGPSGSRLANPTHAYATAHQRRECHFFGTKRGPSQSSICSTVQPFNRSTVQPVDTRNFNTFRASAMAPPGHAQQTGFAWIEMFMMPFLSAQESVRRRRAVCVSRTLTDVCPAAQTGAPASSILFTCPFCYLSQTPSCFNEMLSLLCSSRPPV